LQNDSQLSNEDEIEKMTEEQRLQRRMDEQNITIQQVMAGDSTNYPIIGDIVRVKYTVAIAATGKQIFSTKHVLERPWVEFVLGINQVVKGFDRALPKMSVGERAKITVTSEYGCK
jgi:FK506-binding protein 1